MGSPSNYNRRKDSISHSLFFSLKFVLLSLCATCAQAREDNDVQRLYNDLLLKRTSYKYARPVFNLSEPVIMYMNLSLTQILDVDEKNQMIKVNLWVIQEWNDPNLRWDPKNYGNVSELKVPVDEIWTPDLVLYNNAGGSWDLASSSNAKLIIFHDSRVVWKPPIIYQLACDIDVEFFPFDTQSCKLKMGTWTHNGYAIDLRHMAQKSSDLDMGLTTYDGCKSTIDYAIDISEYQENGEWDLLEVSAKRNIKTYSCCAEPFLDITFVLVIRRRTLFYVTILISPCMAISLLTVIVFYLPADSRKKITLSISVLIALTMFILLVFELTPATSLVIPLITKFLLFTMIIITVSIIASIVIVNVRFQSPETNKISPWMRALFINTLPQFLCMQRPLKKDKSAIDKCLEGANLQQLNLNEEKIWQRGHHQRRTAMHFDAINDLELALLGARNIANYIKNATDSKDVENDWKFIASVMDRLLLLLFSAAVLIGICGIILQAPPLFDNKVALQAKEAPYLQSRINYTRLC